MKNKLMNWCSERMQDCTEKQSALRRDGRVDEARFMQIRANVYNIFRQVANAVGDNPAALQNRLTDIPAAWESSLALAEKHDDAEKAHIERIKLETAQAIRHYVSNLQEAPHDGE